MKKNLIISTILISSLVHASEKQRSAIETTPKASPTIEWTFELRNKSSEDIKIQLFTDHPTKQLFGSKLIVPKKTGFFESGVSALRTNKVPRENKRIFLGIYSKDGEFIAGYQLNRAGDTPILVSWEKGDLRPQKGVKTSDKEITARTQSGIPLRKAGMRENNNITDQEIVAKDKNQFELLTELNR